MARFRKNRDNLSDQEAFASLARMGKAAEKERAERNAVAKAAFDALTQRQQTVNQAQSAYDSAAQRYNSVVSTSPELKRELYGSFYDKNMRGAQVQLERAKTAQALGKYDKESAYQQYKEGRKSYSRRRAEAEENLSAAEKAFREATKGRVRQARRSGDLFSGQSVRGTSDYLTDLNRAKKELKQVKAGKYEVERKSGDKAADNLLRNEFYERYGQERLQEANIDEELDKILDDDTHLVQGELTRTDGGEVNEGERVRKELVQKGFSEEDIDELLDARRVQRDKAVFEESGESGKKLAGKGWMGAAAATAASIPMDLAGGITNVANLGVQAAGNAISGERKPVNIYGGGFATNYSMQAQDAVAEQIDNPIIRSGYGILTSIIQSTGMRALGPAGEFALAATAASRSAIEGRQRGLSDEQMLATSLAAGVSEWAWEHLGLDALAKMQSVTGGTGKRAWTMVNNIVKAAVPEALEEGGTDLTNFITDAIINGDLSEHQQKIRQYMDQGMSYDEAYQQAGVDFARQIAESMIGGFISGGILGGGQTIAQENAYNRGVGDFVRSTGGVEDLIAQTQEIDPQNKSAKRAFDEVTRAKSEQPTEGRRVQRSDPTARVKNRDIRNMLEAVGEQKKGDLLAKAQELTAEMENGETVARALTKNVRGELLTRAEQNALKNLGEGEQVRLESELRYAQYEAEQKKEGKTQRRDVEKMVTDAVGRTWSMPTSIEEAAEEYEGPAAEVFKKAYQPGQDPGAYSLAYHMAYTYGQESVLSAKGSNAMLQAAQNSAGKYLTESQLQAAFEVGKTMRQGTMKYNAPKNPGFYVKGEDASKWSSKEIMRRTGVSLEAAEQAKAWQKLTKILHVNVNLFQSELVDGKYQGENGRFDASTGTIYIDLNAGLNSESDIEVAQGLTMSHELTHYIRSNNEKGYAALRDFIQQHLMSEEWEDAIQRQINRAAENGQEMSRSEAMEELVADGCQMMLKDSKAIETLAKENRSLYDTIRDFLHDFVEKLKTAFGTGPRDATAQKMVEYAEELQKVWDEALVGAAHNAENGQKNSATQEGGVKMSVREIIDETGKNYGIGVYLDSDLLTGLSEEESKQMVKLRVVEELAGKTFLAYDGSTPVQISVARENEKIRSSTGRSKSVLKELYNKYAGKEIKREAVVLADELIQASRYSTTEPARHKHGWLDNYGKNDWDKRTVHIQDKNNAVWEATLHIANATDGRKILYDIDPIIKKAEGARKSAPTTATNSITDSAEKSTSKMSRREYLDAVENGDMATAQRMVDEAAEEAMADSKIRGKDGKLLTVYHGTKDNFNVFDTAIKGGINGIAEGYGIYTSDDPEVSEKYGDRQIKMYANIKKPATSTKKTVKQTTLAKLIEDTCKREAQRMVDDGEYDSVKDALRDTWVSNYVYTYDMSMAQAYREVAQSILDLNGSDMEVVMEVMNGMAIQNYGEAFQFYWDSLTPITGFDGFWTTWENDDGKSNIILAFDSSQLKETAPATYDDAGKIIPLEERFGGSQDIRYSQRDYQEAVAKNDMAAAQKIVEQAAEEWGAYQNTEEANQIFPQEGRVRKFFHGTREQFNTFDDSYRGMASGDSGFYGKGHYFAFSAGEAKYYAGGGRVIEAYLQMKKPFIYDTLYRFEGVRSGGTAAGDAVWIVNMAEQFPDLVKDNRVEYTEKYDDNIKSMSFQEFAKLFRKTAKNVKFDVQPVQTSYGTEYLVTADEHEVEFEDYKGEKHTYKEWGFQQRFLSEDEAKNKANQVFYYLTNKFGYLDMPRPVNIVQDIELSEELKKQGYDSILQSESGDEAIVFSPEQIKSADPVTYDDQGNVIPLEKRFSDSKDIRYSRRDEDYIPYHHTAILAEDRVDRYLKEYASPSNKKYAQAYIGWMSPNNFLKATSTLVGRIYIEKETGELDAGKLRSETQPIYLRVEDGQVVGHEGRHRMAAMKGEGITQVPVLIFDSSNKYSKTAMGSASYLGQEFSSGVADGLANVENLVPLSYENRDQVVSTFATPSSGARMSEKYGASKVLRFSRRENTMSNSEILLNTLEGANAHETKMLELYRKNYRYLETAMKEGKQDDVKRLQKVLGEMEQGSLNNLLLRQQSYINERLGKTERNSVIRDILRGYSSTAKIADLKEAWDLMQQNLPGGKVTDVARATAQEIASEIIDKARVRRDGSFADYEGLREDLKTPILVSENLKEQITDWNQWRKANFGRLSLKNGEMTNVDTLYEDLQARYGYEVFPEKSNEADMLQQIADVAQEMREETLENPFADYLDEAKADLAEHILQEGRILAVRNEALGATATANRRAEQAIRGEEKAKSDQEYRRQMDRIATQEHKTTNYFRTRLEQMEAEQRKANIRREDTELRKGMRKRINSKVKKLSRMLLHPTNTDHIPDDMQTAVADFLKCFTGDTSVFERAKLETLKARYEAISDNASYDEDIAAMIGKLSQTIGGKRLSQLNIGETHGVEAIVYNIARMVEDQNEIFVNDRRVKVAKLGTDWMQEASTERLRVQAMPEAQRKALALARGQFLTDNLKPSYFFERLGGTGKTLWADIMEAQNQYAFFMDETKAYFQETMDEYDMWDWLDSDELIEVTSKNGKQVKLTRNEALSILATWKREQMDRIQNAHHLEQGGIKLVDKVKGRDESNQYAVIDQAQVDEILRQLDKEKPGVMGFVDKMVWYLSNTGAARGNEASMKLYGWRKFTGGYYFPFHVAGNTIKSKAGEAGGKKVANMIKDWGASKGLTDNAKLPLEIRGFTEVWSEHMAEMNNYAAMAVPQDNLKRVFDYQTGVDEESTTQTLKDHIVDAYGQAYMKYIDTLIRDMSGGVTVDSREAGVNKWVSLFKKGATGFSTTVFIQQGSSVIRATSMMDYKYFAKTLGTNGFKSYEEAKKYSGIAVLKDIGGYDTGTGRGGGNWISQRESVKIRDFQSLKEYGRRFLKDEGTRDEAAYYLAGKADEFAWGKLWDAVKAEQADLHPELQGEALLQQCGKRFNEVVEKTQVYDSVLTRSAYMRSKSGMVKMATAFMAEPTTTWNMLYEAVSNANTPAGRKQLMRTMGSVIAATVIGNALKAAVGAFRDDDEDETYLQKFLTKWISNTKDDLIPWNLLPFARDLQSMIEGYKVEASYASIWSDAIKAGKQLLDEDASLWDKAAGLIGATAGFAGIPAKNMIREIDAAWNGAHMDYGKTDSLGLRNSIREGLGWDKITVKGLVEDAYKTKNPGKRDKALQDINTIYQQKVEANLKKGLDKEEAEKKAKSSVRSILTKYLKEEYLSLPENKRADFMSFCYRITLGGKQVYDTKDIKKWND